MLLLLLLSSMLVRTYGVPMSYTNITAFDVPSICPDPSTRRTTWTIIKSCIVTAFMCTWVAIHPNIPARTDTCTTIFLRRLKAMFLTLLIPELTVFWSMRQWFGTRKVMEAFKAYGWTQTHAHFVQMGGFFLYDHGVPLRTLTPDELADLSQSGKIDFPKISEEQIQDRSKGDLISKALVAIQTSWFVIQFLARAIQGLFITEIEVVTLAFAVLNGLMYFFWWNKPLDVRCAIPVYLKAVDPLSIGNIDQGVLEGLPKMNETDDAQKLKDENRLHAEIDSSPSQEQQGEFLSVDDSDAENCSQDGISVSYQPVYNRIIYSILSQLLRPTMFVIDCINELDATHPPSFFSIVPHTGGSTTIILLTSGIGMLTGALNCIIWAFPFPSYLEGILWHTATALVIAYPLIQREQRNIGGFNTMLKSLLLFGLVGRVLLLVQAIVSLRNMPAAAFETENWSYIIPHL